MTSCPARDADLQALDAALAAADADGARRHAHRIKGAARTVGANAVAALAQEIETDAAAGAEAARLTALAARLHDAFADCREASGSLA